MPIFTCQRQSRQWTSVYPYIVSRGIIRPKLKVFGIMQETIELKLTNQLAPTYLSVINESHMHNVAKNSQTHFKCIIVSESFVGLNKVKQHQMVYQILAEELAGSVHALALHTFTPQSWQENQRDLASPNCMGGSKK